MATPQTQSRVPKILLVEDDKTIFNACAVLFRHYEYQVAVANTVAEGRRLAPAGFDLIILDLLLPDGEGTEILQQVRTGGIKSKVFILTGGTDKTAELKLRRWMPDRFFRKPLNFLEILEAARETLAPAPSPDAKVASFLDGKKSAA